MGAVWLARDELLGREVAVKQVLRARRSATEEADQQRQRALREGRIAARLSHPHAISVYDVAVEQRPAVAGHGVPALAQPGRGARRGRRAAGATQVAQIGAQVADALAADARGRDRAPRREAGEHPDRRGRPVEGLVKITDFGISHASGDVTLTQTGQITGTPAFLAPEVAQGTSR